MLGDAGAPPSIVVSVREPSMDRLALLLACVCFFCFPAMVLAEGKRPMKVDDLFAFKRVTDPQVSPDGKHVVYVVATVDLPATKTPSPLSIAPTAGTAPPPHPPTPPATKTTPPT